MSVCGQEIRVAADQARTGAREITGAQKKGERRFIVIANDVGREKLNAAWQMGPVHAASEPVPENRRRELSLLQQQWIE